MKTYLITGASGFIGSHLAEKLLNHGYRVINVDNFNDYYDLSIKIKNTLESLGKLEKYYEIKTLDDKELKLNKLGEIVAGEKYSLEVIDIRDFKKLEEVFEKYKIDIVIHLAARAGVRPSLEDPILYQEVNGRGTQNILECCKKYGIRNLVAASSSSVYGNNKKVPFKEIDIVDFAISPYAATKKSNEVMGHVYHSLYNINMAFLRFFTVYGPRQRPDLAINKFSRLILEDKEIPVYGDGSTSRDYTYIDDIVEGIINAANYIENNKNIYEIFNIGSNNPISLKEMIETIEKVLEKKAKINRLPMQPGDVDKTYADISKLKNMTGYNPKTSFEEGVRNFINWYKKEEVKD